MSEMYEGVVFRSDENTARSVFGSLSSQLVLRLVRLRSDVFGIYRVAVRAEAFYPPAVENIAQRVSLQASQAIALFYDNGCGIRAGVLYANGHRTREFGDGDAWWVLYGEDNEPDLNGPRFRESELRPDEEYDCIFSAIDAALEAISAGPEITASVVKQAFCYEEAEVLAKSGKAS